MAAACFPMAHTTIPSTPTNGSNAPTVIRKVSSSLKRLKKRLYDIYKRLANQIAISLFGTSITADLQEMFEFDERFKFNIGDLVAYSGFEGADSWPTETTTATLGNYIRLVEGTENDNFLRRGGTENEEE
jgi:hypothetical protein